MRKCMGVKVGVEGWKYLIQFVYLFRQKYMLSEAEIQNLPYHWSLYYRELRQHLNKMEEKKVFGMLCL